MSQLAAIVPKEERICRYCKKKDPRSYLEIEGVFVVVRKSEPYPWGGSIFINRGIFCNMKCLSDYMKLEYKRGIEGKEERLFWQK